jgi:hypothetical protein
MESTKIVIRPFASKKGIMSLFFCSLIGIVIFALTLVISILVKEYQMLLFLGILSAVIIILGIVLYLLFPRVKIIFDVSSQNTIIRSSKSPEQVIPFNQLQPFMIYETIRGYAHQYYCRNNSFGDYSDLFFSARHVSTLKKAKRLAKFTGGTLIGCDGKIINLE